MSEKQYDIRYSDNSDSEWMESYWMVYNTDFPDDQIADCGEDKANAELICNALNQSEGKVCISRELIEEALEMENVDFVNEAREIFDRALEATPVTQAQFDSINELVGDVEVDLDAPLPKETMVLSFDPSNGTLWHSDCEKSSSGIIVKTEHEEERTLMTCGHCGMKGYYPKGGVGRIEVPVEDGPSTPEVKSQ